MTQADKFILDTEKKVFDHLRPGKRESFCLATFVQVEPVSPNAKYGKKLVSNILQDQAASSAEHIQCRVPGCDVQVSKTDLELLGGSCKLANECLREVWEANGSYDELESHGEHLGPGAFGCKNPLCDFSCGWSEDTVPGTDGACLNEV